MFWSSFNVELHAHTSVNITQDSSSAARPSHQPPRPRGCLASCTGKGWAVYPIVYIP
jgi:hypothetical protein